MNQVQADKIGRLDVMKMIEKLFANLNEREQDILKRRFGLNRKKKATLEEIGQTHHLTRERIRQIETGSINKIKKLEKISEVVSDLRTLVTQLLEDHGGTMDKEYLFDILLILALDPDELKLTDREIFKNHFSFILGRILDTDFKEVESSKHFNPVFSMRYQEFEHS
jgi:transcriptional regulator with XRE-family HTH domain